MIKPLLTTYNYNGNVSKNTFYENLAKVTGEGIFHTKSLQGKISLQTISSLKLARQRGSFHPELVADITEENGLVKVNGSISVEHFTAFIFRIIFIGVWLMFPCMYLFYLVTGEVKFELSNFLNTLGIGILASGFLTLVAAGIWRMGKGLAKQRISKLIEIVEKCGQDQDGQDKKQPF